MKLQNLVSLGTILVYLLVTLMMVGEFPESALAAEQEPFFELPVQLIGFPVIILSVRLSNFAKKLAYSLNPNTYRARTKRSAPTEGLEFSKSAVDTAVAEKEILKEFGPKACILEEPCRLHAIRPGKRGEQPDWNDILRNYKVQSTGMKQWYLLSVFVGDVIRDVQLCKQLAKRLECGRNEKPFTRD